MWFSLKRRPGLSVIYFASQSKRLLQNHRSVWTLFLLANQILSFIHPTSCELWSVSLLEVSSNGHHEFSPMLCTLPPPLTKQTWTERRSIVWANRVWSVCSESCSAHVQNGSQRYCVFGSWKRPNHRMCRNHSRQRTYFSPKKNWGARIIKSLGSCCMSFAVCPRKKERHVDKPTQKLGARCLWVLLRGWLRFVFRCATECQFSPV